MKKFATLAAFVRHMETLPVAVHAARHRGLRDAAEHLEKGIKATLGTYQTENTGPFGPWPELADLTKELRGEAGYKENEPLLVTGALRDSIGITLSEQGAQVGSDSDIAVIQELGSGRVPARSFIGLTTFRQSKTLVDLMVAPVIHALAGLPPSNRPKSAEQFSEFGAEEIPF